MASGSGQALEAFAASQEVTASGDGRASTESGGDNVGSTGRWKLRLNRVNRLFVLRASFVDKDISVILLQSSVGANVTLTPRAEHVITTTTEVVILHGNLESDHSGSTSFVIADVDAFFGG